jgi:hypothetical protein
MSSKKSPRYFLGLFTIDSWREFKRNGGKIMGFNEKKAHAAQQLVLGDKILCYLTKVSAFIGVMEVTGPAYIDQTPIWSDGLFPVRLPVRLLHEASLSAALPIRSLSEKLSFMKNSESNTGWTIHVRTSPRLWKTEDAIAVVKALKKHASSDLEKRNKHVRVSKQVTGKAFKETHFALSTRVGLVIQKSHQVFENFPADVIGSYDNAISFNKVTGYSVNVPIATTCKPTAMCLKTCYFAVGAPSWTNSLRHQARVFASIKTDPIQFAERVALEYDKLGLTFLRWNGGGDLFAESVTAVNHLGKIRPDITLWVVTRIPEFAAQVDELKNVFIHFSLDRHSLARREQFLSLKPRSKNYFFSYQCEPDETPDPERLGQSAVVFFDNYRPSGDLAFFDKEILCPLNGKENISGTCVKCRRCFNGDAVKYEKMS